MGDSSIGPLGASSAGALRRRRLLVMEATSPMSPAPMSRIGARMPSPGHPMTSWCTSGQIAARPRKISPNTRDVTSVSCRRTGYHHLAKTAVHVELQLPAARTVVAVVNDVRLDTEPAVGIPVEDS
jgi:hypothetical protein